MSSEEPKEMEPADYHALMCKISDKCWNLIMEETKSATPLGRWLMISRIVAVLFQCQFQLSYGAAMKAMAEHEAKLIEMKSIVEQARFVVENGMPGSKSKIELAQAVCDFAEAMAEIKQEVGTSTRAWSLADKALEKHGVKVNS